MVIRWRQGSQYKVDPKVAHDQIESLRKRHGGEVSAEQLVSAAKVKSSPLHGEFEWNDSKAANEHRLQTARHMMRCLVVVRDELQTTRPQRVYEVVRLPKTEEKTRIKHVYKTTEDIMQDADLRAELLGRALAELISIRNRYRDLNELAIVLRAIDEVVAAAEV